MVVIELRFPITGFCRRLSHMAKRSDAAKRLRRSVVVALLAIVVSLFSEQRARAETSTDQMAFFILGGTAAGLTSAPFLVADVVYTVQLRWLPPAWAGTQIGLGGAVNAGVAAWGIGMYLSPNCANSCVNGPGVDCVRGCGELLPLTIAAAVVSVGFIAHGVASLVLYEPPKATKVSGGIGLPSHGVSLRWAPDIVVTRDGNTLVAFRGVF